MKKILILILCFILIGCNKEINKEENKNMKIIIDNQEYIVNLENNSTVNKMLELLPLEIEMNELNGNEKYYYLDKSLPNNPKLVDKINKGDVMLYGDNCIVIFYKTFNTSYTYTKIGHIDNLPDLNNQNIKVIFKNE